MNWGMWIQRLDEERDVKRLVYRWHRLAGVLLFAGALYTLDALWFAYEPGTLARLLENWGNGQLRAVLAEALWFFLFGGNALALGAALIVIFRPSVLKGLERWTDRFYGARK